MSQTMKSQNDIPVKDLTPPSETELITYELFMGVLILCMKKGDLLIQTGVFKSMQQAKKFAKLAESYAGKKMVFIFYQDFLYKVMIGHFTSIEDAHSAITKIKPLLEAENEKIK